MGIPLGGGNFTRGAAIPLDDSFVAATVTVRDAIVSGIRHDGMLVYVIADQTMYQLKGGILNTNWATVGGGGGGATPIINLFTGTGAQTVFTLSVDPGTKDNTLVFISGAYQNKDTYSLVTTALTFSEAPPLGVKIQVISGSVTTVNVPANLSVTTSKLATANQVISASSGSFATTSTSSVDVPNLSCSITTFGRPVQFELFGGEVSTGSNSTSLVVSYFEIYRDATWLTTQRIQVSYATSFSNAGLVLPSSVISYSDPVAAGTYVYKLKAYSYTTSVTTNVINAKLSVKEV